MLRREVSRFSMHYAGKEPIREYRFLTSAVSLTWTAFTASSPVSLPPCSRPDGKGDLVYRLLSRTRRLSVCKEDRGLRSK